MHKSRLSTEASISNDLPSTSGASISIEEVSEPTQPTFAEHSLSFTSSSAEIIEEYNQYTQQNRTPFVANVPQDQTTVESARSPCGRLGSRILALLRCKSTNTDLLPSYAAATAVPQSFLTQLTEALSFRKWYTERALHQLEKEYTAACNALTNDQDSKIQAFDKQIQQIEHQENKIMRRHTAECIQLVAEVEDELDHDLINAKIETLKTKHYEELKQYKAKNDAHYSELFTQLRELFNKQGVEYTQVCNHYEQIFAKKNTSTIVTIQAPPPSYAEASNHFRIFAASPQNDTQFYINSEKSCLSPFQPMIRSAFNFRE